MKDNICAICLQQITGNDVKELSFCSKHIFHKSCLNDWYKIKEECPKCRANTTTLTTESKNKCPELDIYTPQQTAQSTNHSANPYDIYSP